MDAVGSDLIRIVGRQQTESSRPVVCSGVDDPYILPTSVEK